MAIFTNLDFVSGFSAIANCKGADIAIRINNRADFIQRQFISDFFGADFFSEIAVNLDSEDPEWIEFKSKLIPALLAFFVSDWLIFSQTIAAESGGTSTGSPASSKQSNVKKSVEQYNASVLFANDFLTWLKGSDMVISSIPATVKKTKLLPSFNY